MRKLLVLSVSHLVMVAIGYFAAIHSGHLNWGDNKPLDDDKNIFIIVAVPNKEADERTNEVWFRKHVLAPGNSDLWPYAREGKMFGHTGCIFSKQPLGEQSVVPKLW